jgi:DNA-binding response OmpR family regulator
MSRVLIIEDQADIRRLIRWALQPGKHEIFEASTGRAGLDSIPMSRPDIVLLDVMMPGGLDGYQVCQQLRAEAATASIPILMLTAKAFESDRQASTQAGASDFLAKPFSPAELSKRVDELLRTALTEQLQSKSV